jgi:hypothetical protein
MYDTKMNLKETGWEGADGLICPKVSISGRIW